MWHNMFSAELLPTCLGNMGPVYPDSLDLCGATHTHICMHSQDQCKNLHFYKGLWHNRPHWFHNLHPCSQADTHRSTHSSGPCTCHHAGRGWSHIHQCPVHTVCLEAKQLSWHLSHRLKSNHYKNLFSQLTTITRKTPADELVHAILTRSSIFTWITSTLIHVTEAACIIVTTWTFTFEAIHKVHANTAICTWITRTFIDVGFTVLASKPRDTITWIPVHHTQEYNDSSGFNP
jgi:hypothetical protein